MVLYYHMKELDPKGVIMQKLVSVSLTCAFLVGAGPAPAHHSVAAYASDTALEISGVVSRVAYTNPHAYYVVDVTDELGNVTSWKVETAAPAVLRRNGWDAGLIKVGDQLTATGFPLLSGDPEMNLESLVLADGTRLSRTGQRGGGEEAVAAAVRARLEGTAGPTGAGGPGMGPGGPGMGRGGPGMGGGGGEFPPEPEPSGAPREYLTGVWASNFGGGLARPRDPQGDSKLTDAGRAAFEAFDISTENMANCRLVGTPRQARGTVYSYEIVDTGDIIYLISEYNAQTRRIYMAGQEPDQYFAPNKLGWSSGSFENGVLSITTRHLTREYIDASAGYYFGGGEDAYMEEKFFISDDGNQLVVFVWYHDPANYSEPYRTSQVRSRMDTKQGFMLDCEPTDYSAQ